MHIASDGYRLGKGDYRDASVPAFTCRGVPVVVLVLFSFPWTLTARVVVREAEGSSSVAMHFRRPVLIISSRRRNRMSQLDMSSCAIRAHGSNRTMSRQASWVGADTVTSIRSSGYALADMTSISIDG